MEMESEMWQVCELEEEKRGVSEYTTAAVPENWIIELDDGTFICCWPKKNQTKKIRQLVRPQLNGPDWSTFKCRVLMNGSKLFFNKFVFSIRCYTMLPVK